MNNFSVRNISFILIFSLILIFPGSLPKESVNAEVGDNIVNIGTAEGDVETTGSTLTVTFDPQEGNKAVPPSYTVTYGQPYGNLATTSREYYTFAGWYTEPNGGGTKIVNTSTVVIENDHTLFAHWINGQTPAPKEYILTFDVVGGNKISPNTKKVTYNEKYGSLPTPAKKGHSFLGWYTAKTGGSRISSNDTVSITKNQTLYARWQANVYKVSFKANAKKVKKLSSRNKKVTYNTKLGKLPSPKREGYKHIGWYTKPTGGTKVTRNTVMKYDRNITLYARWSKNAKIANCYVVKLRKGSSNNSQVIKFVKRNTKVCYIIKLKSGWVKVKVGNKTGYIDRRYLKKI